MAINCLLTNYNHSKIYNQGFKVRLFLLMLTKEALLHYFTSLTSMIGLYHVAMPVDSRRQLQIFQMRPK